MDATLAGDLDCIHWSSQKEESNLAEFGLVSDVIHSDTKEISLNTDETRIWLRLAGINPTEY